MTQIKKQYYIKGHASQKRSDVSFELKRVDISKLVSMENEDKFRLIDFLRECQNDIQLTIDRLQP